MTKTKSEDEPQIERYHPTLEEFLEQEPRSAVSEVFDPLREKLGELKGTKAAGAKKVLAAVEATESLLHHLYDVKDQMAADATAKPKK